ncbi:unnamed protein product, partial [Symbiodinium sp. KB8]
VSALRRLAWSSGSCRPTMLLPPAASCRFLEMRSSSSPRRQRLSSGSGSTLTSRSMSMSPATSRYWARSSCRSRCTSGRSRTQSLPWASRPRRWLKGYKESSRQL